jgi:DNA-binding GntR family transcriptional regulator
VRAWVLTRQVPLDQPLEPAALAASMDLEASHVAYALVRLAGEHVVGRTADGRYLPIPLTIELADQLFGARCVIELGVADLAVGHVADDDIAVLDGYAQRLVAVMAADDANLDEFLDTSHSYHLHFVGLGGSPQLQETYAALGISVLWRRAIEGQDWRSEFDIVHHAALTEACRDGDLARARDLISEHTEQVRGLVRTLIDRAGGAL